MYARAIRASIAILVAMAGLSSLAGCARLDLTELGYETLRSAHAVECARERSARCAPRPHYDTYRKERMQ